LPADQGAQRSNLALVAHLRETGALTDPRVAAAFCDVLRHRFLPGRRLSEIYEDAAILTKVGEQGVPMSSSSQPAIMAVMLEQLGPRPGHRVLEIGAGTGYNAALLAHLVGPDGGVVSVDIDEELCVQARANLAGAGVEGVEVVHADGAGGWPAGAPYDAIMLTASASDLACAWVDQLAPGGRLVLPLILAGPMQLSVALEKRDGLLTSNSVAWCGFMPLRGEMAVGGDPSEAPERPPGGLGGPASPAGVEVPAADLRAGFESWLALTHEDYVRLHPRAEEPPVFGLADDRGAALVVAADGRYGVQLHGEASAAFARLAAAHREWARRRPRAERLRVAAFPSGSDPPEGVGGRLLRRERFTFAVSWS
jgi:protein-L-isoaspartate(D-aspartate) O-methyltransferase